MRTTRALAALAIGAALTLAGCGSNDQSTGADQASTSATDHNDADVDFASDMIQHHAQALAMVDLTVDRELDPEVQRLADDVRAAQGPEIETMSDWLQEWGEEVPETVRDHSNSEMDMGEDDMADMGGDMPGMMSPDDMQSLEAATDAEFPGMWLAMMTEHHEGAIEMARDQVENGQYKPAVDLAGQIEAAQTREVEMMNELQGR